MAEMTETLEGESELAQMERRLVEVRRKQSEEEGLVKEITRKKQEKARLEGEVLRRQAVPLKKKEIELAKVLIKQVNECQKSLKELTELQSKLPGLKSGRTYVIPPALAEGMTNTIQYFKNWFPEVLGLPARLSQKEKNKLSLAEGVKRAEERLAQLQRYQKEMKTSIPVELQKAEEEVEVAREKLDYARSLS